MLEAIQLAPDDARTSDWYKKRWILLGWNQEPAVVATEVLADIERIMAMSPPRTVQDEASYLRAFYRVHQLPHQPADQWTIVEDFLARFPRDERGAVLLDSVADNPKSEDSLRIQCYRRLASDFPKTHAGSFAPGLIRRIQSIGKPFELRFRDLLTNREIAIENFRNKVIVIDFWATTCLPCIAQLPALKEIHARYHSRGVEFIGVSLDEPESADGREALWAACKTHAIPWPQYYQGNGYDSEFSRDWGVGSAPTIFVVDQQGRFVAVSKKDQLPGLLDRLLAQ